jgi:hypothetical protein
LGEKAVSKSATQTKKTARGTLKILLICGIVASLLYIGDDILAGLSWKGYSFLSQAISEESAVGAPPRQIELLPFPLYSLLVIAFGLGILMVAGERRALRIIGILQVSIGLVGIAWTAFPMHLNEPQSSFANVMHTTFAGIQTLQILSSISLGIIAFRKHWFGKYSIGTLAAVVTCGILTFMIAGGFVPQLAGYIGLLERISVHGFMVWVIVLGVALLREEKNRQASIHATNLQHRFLQAP